MADYSNYPTLKMFFPCEETSGDFITDVVGGLEFRPEDEQQARASTIAQVDGLAGNQINFHTDSVVDILEAGETVTLSGGVGDDSLRKTFTIVGWNNSYIYDVAETVVEGSSLTDATAYRDMPLSDGLEFDPDTKTIFPRMAGGATSNEGGGDRTANPTPLQAGQLFDIPARNSFLFMAVGRVECTSTPSGNEASRVRCSLGDNNGIWEGTSRSGLGISAYNELHTVILPWVGSDAGTIRKENATESLNWDDTGKDIILFVKHDDAIATDCQSWNTPEGTLDVDTPVNAGSIQDSIINAVVTLSQTSFIRIQGLRLYSLTMFVFENGLPPDIDTGILWMGRQHLNGVRDIYPGAMYWENPAMANLTYRGAHSAAPAAQLDGTEYIGVTQADPVVPGTYFDKGATTNDLRTLSTDAFDSLVNCFSFREIGSTLTKDSCSGQVAQAADTNIAWSPSGLQSDNPWTYDGFDSNINLKGFIVVFNIPKTGQVTSETVSIGVEGASNQFISYTDNPNSIRLNTDTAGLVNFFSVPKPALSANQVVAVLVHPPANGGGRTVEVYINGVFAASRILPVDYDVWGTWDGNIGFPSTGANMSLGGMTLHVFDGPLPTDAATATLWMLGQLDTGQSRRIWPLWVNETHIDDTRNLGQGLVSYDFYNATSANLSSQKIDGMYSWTKSYTPYYEEVEVDVDGIAKWKLDAGAINAYGTSYSFELAGPKCRIECICRNSTDTTVEGSNVGVSINVDNASGAGLYALVADEGGLVTVRLANNDNVLLGTDSGTLVGADFRTQDVILIAEYDNTLGTASAWLQGYEGQKASVTGLVPTPLSGVGIGALQNAAGNTTAGNEHVKGATWKQVILDYNV